MPHHRSVPNIALKSAARSGSSPGRRGRRAKPLIMPVMAPILVVRFHQMPSTSGANRPAAASENAHATIWMMPEGRVPATAAAMIATPTSSTRATISRRAVEALGSIIL